jgi:Xaa-Pro aminopeptidase
MLFNRDRALELMGRYNLDAIVASTPENIQYVSGLEGWTQNVYRYQRAQAFALFFRDRDARPALLIPSQENTYAAAQRLSVPVAYIYGRRGGLDWPDGAKARGPEEQAFARLVQGRTFANPLEGLVWILHDRGCLRGRIALDEERCVPSIRDGLKRELGGGELLPGSNLFRFIRLVKTRGEIARLRAAATANEKAYAAVIGAARRGVAEVQVAAVYREAVARAGGLFGWFHFGGGRRSCTMFPPSRYRLRKGDLYVFDAGMSLGGYYADTGGCGLLGQPDERHRRTYKAIRAGLDAALAKVRAGVTGSTIYHALMDGVHKGGLPNFHQTFAGHTIGLEPREFPFTLGPTERVTDPFLPDTSDAPLPEGAVINLEVPAGEFGWGGMQVEVSVIVKAQGFAPLIPMRRRLELGL